MTAAVQFVINGGGSVISGGTYGFIDCPFNATIERVRMFASPTGGFSVDIWSCLESMFSPPTHPAVGDSITGTDLPTVSSGVVYSDTTLTGWNVGVTAGNVFCFNVQGPSGAAGPTGVQQLTISLELARTGT
jgi:hypothetical protein